MLMIFIATAIENPRVTGSIPVRATNLYKASRDIGLFILSHSIVLDYT
jgi:hypothetical protein